MLTVKVEKIGDIAVIGCEGRIVSSEAVFKLGRAITSQLNARAIVLDLSEVYAIEGGALSTLSALRKWSQDHQIEFKVYNPTLSVRNRLVHCESLQFEVASFHEMMAMLERAVSQHANAA